MWGRARLLFTRKTLQLDLIGCGLSRIPAGTPARVARANGLLEATATYLVAQTGQRQQGGAATSDGEGLGDQRVEDQRGGAESSGAGSKATLGLRRDELQAMKQLLEKAQEEQATKQEVLGAKEDIAKAQDAMRQELKLEMALAAEAQEQQTPSEKKKTKHIVRQRRDGKEKHKYERNVGEKNKRQA